MEQSKTPDASGGGEPLAQLLREARIWVAAAVAPLRNLAPSACQAGDSMLARIDAALASAPPAGHGNVERVRHVKSGGDYEVLDRKARLQTNEPLTDYAEVVVYRSTTGTTWVRPVAEMNDGRFVPLASAPPAPTPEAGSDLDKLAELNKAATPGPWYVVDTPWGNGDWICAGSPDPHTGTAICNFKFLEEDREHGGPTPLDDAAFVAALVTAYRSGSMTRASFAEHYTKRTHELAKRVRELEVALIFHSPPPSEDLAGQGEPVTTIIHNGDHAEFEQEWAGRDPKDRPDWPLPSFDARVWAEAFCQRFQVTRKDDTPDDGDDTGLMIGWFANALMRGFDERTRRSARLADLDLSAAPTAQIRPMDHLSWAVSRWRDEVEKRPLRNVHRRSLDDTWRQVIRYFGADPKALIGPSHDDLVNAAQSNFVEPEA